MLCSQTLSIMAPTNKNSNKKETPTKATGNGDRKPAASKGSPSSAFESGKFSGAVVIDNSRDTRYRLFSFGVEGVGHMHYVAKATKEEEAFLHHDYEVLCDESALERIGVNGILERKGVDGQTAMPQRAGSIYGWRQLMVICSEADNTPSKRKTAAARNITHLNSKASNIIAAR